MILVIDNYDSFTWNLVHYLEELGARTRVVRNDKMTVPEALECGLSALLLSPGPCTPDDAGICVDLVKAAPADLPILGVCLGHQAIGQAFGGKVAEAKEIRHGKLSTVQNDGTPLFVGLPRTFDVVRYHSLALHGDDMPDCLQVDARTGDNEIMAISHTERPIYGVQFHPESIQTAHGHALLKNFLNQVTM